MINSKEGLTRFYKKTKFVQRASEEDFADGLAQELADYGTSIARINYNITSRSVKCSNEKIESGSYKIVAHDISKKKHIAFMEYGTGVRGKGTYPEDLLPKEKIPITGGWIHDFRKQNWQGMESKSQMYYTFIDIEYGKNEIIREFIERESAKYE